MAFVALLLTGTTAGTAQEAPLGSGEHYFQAHYAAMAEIRDYDVLYSGFTDMSPETGQSYFLEMKGRTMASEEDDMVVGLKKYERSSGRSSSDRPTNDSAQSVSRMEVYSGRLIGNDLVARKFPGGSRRAKFPKEISPYYFHGLEGIPAFPLFGIVNFPLFMDPAGKSFERTKSQRTTPTANQQLIRETANEAVVRIEVEKSVGRKRRLFFYFDAETLLIVGKRVSLHENNSWNPIFKGEYTYTKHNGLYVPESMRVVTFKTRNETKIVERHTEVMYEWKDLDRDRAKQWRVADLWRIENLDRLIEGEDIAEIGTEAPNKN
ncbi:hypothetical protein [Rhodopirellula sp. P2]|uniref:hypothetical protein n=1 Tax=Rhodopirellula sp. P2 TaxID=2127060 RepID=UPI00236800CA|nr:hypothetical protein [Rhodopirellula sp. P2]WDQ18314.1 hypothetical protein PSR62_07150 [Rhodopirellula sp. P2]